MGHRGGTPKTNCELWHVNTIDECMIAMTAYLEPGSIVTAAWVQAQASVQDIRRPHNWARNMLWR